MRQAMQRLRLNAYIGKHRFSKPDENGGGQVFSLQFRVRLEEADGMHHSHKIGWASNISEEDEDELLLYGKGNVTLRDHHDDTIAIISGTGITAARLQLQNCIIEDWRPMLGHNRRYISDCKIKRTELERWIVPSRRGTKNAGKIRE